MSDLQIPAAALDAYEEAGSYRHALKIAAPLIVAPAYRAVADRLEKGAYSANASSPVTVAVADGVQIAMALLRHLADELDGGAK